MESFATKSIGASIPGSCFFATESVAIESVTMESVAIESATKTLTRWGFHVVKVFVNLFVLLELPAVAQRAKMLSNIVRIFVFKRVGFFVKIFLAKLHKIFAVHAPYG